MTLRCVLLSFTFLCSPILVFQANADVLTLMYVFHLFIL